ncbi:MAG: protein kinase [bacterium]|nr:protein kinase [bacterium]
MRSKPAVPKLLKAAQSAGLIDEITLQRALSATTDPNVRTGSWGPEIEFLLREGSLEPSQIVRLAREIGDRDLEATRVAGQDSSPELLGSATPTPDAAALRPLADVTDDPAIATWDRYRIKECLGRGGMGSVYRAHDLQLDRDVAIKFLHRRDPDVVRRFWREARSQAQADHENICQVYEVGEHAGHVFIAMQLVEGQSLMEAGLFMTLEERVRVMIAVCRAVHAAHQRSLIHRDLKPANVMVEQTARGWRPFVLDFGIARDLRNDDLTETGTVMGTMAYISPEQARGVVTELDARSDVYGLGATMYTLFAGTPPFAQSEGADTLWRIAHEDIHPLRQREPSVPKDIDTIVMKCLEKEPERRYQSARQVADDLERFITGDPILAQPPTISYRIKKWTRKNNRLATVVATALVALSIMGAVAIKTRLDSSKRATLAHQLGQEVREMETTTLLSAMLPTHNRSAEVDALRQRLERIESETEELGSFARGPASHALGNGYLLLDDYTRAVHHLQTAWNEGYQEPADAYALGRAYGGKYQQALEELRQVEDPQTRESQQAEIERELLDQAIHYLQEAESSGTDAPTYVKGLIAFYEKRYDQALDHAKAVTGQVDLIHEARRLEGDIRLEMATEQHIRGDSEASRDAGQLAGDAYDFAATIGRSDAKVFTGLCARWTLEMERLFRSGEPANQAFNSAVASCTIALSINPQHIKALNQLSRANWKWAEHQIDQGGDPESHLDKAIRLAERAAMIDPENLMSHYNRGCALRVTGTHTLSHGDDPRTSFGRAVTSFREALQINPAYVPAHDDLGFSLERKAKYELEQGLDPSPSIEEALASYREALTLSPTYPNSHNNLGIALLRRGQLEAKRGEDPRDTLQEAIESFEKALIHNPNYAYAHINKGFVFHVWADYLVRIDESPSDIVEEGQAAFNAGTSINPNLSWGYRERALLELAGARFARTHDRSPRFALQAATRAIDSARSLSPDNASIWHAAAAVALEKARWFRTNGQDPRNTLQRGEQAVHRALNLQPNSAEAVLTLAFLWQERALTTSEEASRIAAQAEAEKHILHARELDPMLVDLELGKK